MGVYTSTLETQNPIVTLPDGTFLKKETNILTIRNSSAIGIMTGLFGELFIQSSTLGDLVIANEAVTGLKIINSINATSVDASNSIITYAELRNCLSMSSLTFTNCGGLSKVEIVGLPNLSIFLASGAPITSFTIDKTSLTQINLDYCLLTNLDMSGASNLISLNINNTNTTQIIDITGCTQINTLSANNGRLTEATVNDILAKLVANGLSSGTLDLSGGTSSPPTGQGLTDATTLATTYGWTVSVNS